MKATPGVSKFALKGRVLFNRGVKREGARQPSRGFPAVSRKLKTNGGDVDDASDDGAGTGRGAEPEPSCRRCGIPRRGFRGAGPLRGCGSAGLYHLRCWTDGRTKGPLRKPPLGPPGDSPKGVPVNSIFSAAAQVRALSGDR
jgi:hypothetical protein